MARARFRGVKPAVADTTNKLQGSGDDLTIPDFLQRNGGKPAEDQTAQGDSDSSEPKGWRAHFAIHPAATLFPPLSDTELRDLAADIETNGLHEPVAIVHDCAAQRWLILDGRNRLAALELLGRTTCPNTPGNDIYQSVGGDDFDPYAYVLSKNIHRRHLTADQRRELIAKILKAKPEASNRQIAKQAKADDKIVAKVRTELEARSEIPNVKAATDTKGRKQPIRKAQPVRHKTPPGDDKRVTESAEVSIEERRAEHAAIEDSEHVAPPEEIEENILYTLQRINEHARVFNKLFKASAFDREAKERINTAIERMIAKWRSTQKTLTQVVH
jgi:ParB-like chromosome segregation protein Spo0J